MFRFLRRVFILLVLFVIVFLVFRFVKPEATSRFVDKVKSIPTTISSRFHREKKSDIIINGSTTSTKSNFDMNDDEYDYDYYDNEYIPAVIDETDNDGDSEDKSRLEQLNRELDRIIASGNNSETNSDGNAEEIVSELINNNKTPTVEVTGNTIPSGFVVIDVEQPYEPEEQTTTNTQNTTTNSQSNTTTQNTTTTQTNNNTSSQPQRGDCGEGLTVQDCEQMERDFGNYN